MFNQFTLLANHEHIKEIYIVHFIRKLQNDDIYRQEECAEVQSEKKI